MFSKHNVSKRNNEACHLSVVYPYKMTCIVGHTYKTLEGSETYPVFDRASSYVPIYAW